MFWLDRNFGYIMDGFGFLPIPIYTRLLRTVMRLFGRQLKAAAAHGVSGQPVTQQASICHLGRRLLFEVLRRVSTASPKTSEGVKDRRPGGLIMMCMSVNHQRPEAGGHSV